MAAPQGVQFDGTNDYLTRGGDLSGIADGKQGTVFFWLRMAADGGTHLILSLSVGNALPAVEVIKWAGGYVTINANPGAGQVLWLKSDSNIAVADGWVPVLASWDLQAGAGHIYFGNSDVELTGETVLTNATIDYTCGDVGVGGRVDNTFLLNGDLAELWFDASYRDFSVAGNREKFITSGEASVDLGSDGSNPTGSAPLLFLSGDTGSWHSNKGTGGGFAEVGALTDASSNPPDYQEVHSGSASLVLPGLLALAAGSEIIVGTAAAVVAAPDLVGTPEQSGSTGEAASLAVDLPNYDAGEQLAVHLSLTASTTAPAPDIAATSGWQVEANLSAGGASAVRLVVLSRIAQASQAIEGTQLVVSVDGDSAAFHAIACNWGNSTIGQVAGPVSESSILITAPGLDPGSVAPRIVMCVAIDDNDPTDTNIADAFGNGLALIANGYLESGTPGNGMTLAVASAAPGTGDPFPAQDFDNQSTEDGVGFSYELVPNAVPDGLLLPAVAVSGAASQSEVTGGDGALVLPIAALAGTGQESVTGGGALALASSEVAAVGDLTLAGAGALALTPPAAAASGTARSTGSGALDLAATVLAASGSESLAGNGAISVAPVVPAGFGRLAPDGSGAVLLRSPDLDADGALLAQVTVAVVSPAAVVGGSGSERLVGVGAPVMTSPIVAASADLVPEGAAGIALAAVAAAALSDPRPSGIGALAPPTVAVLAAGGSRFEGLVALELSAVRAAALATLDLLGEATMSLEATGIAGEGNLLPRGAGTITSAIAALFAESDPQPAGAGALELPHAVATASGTQRVVAAGELDLIGPSLGGVGLAVPRGAASIDLAMVGLEADALLSFGVGGSALVVLRGVQVEGAGLAPVFVVTHKVELVGCRASPMLSGAVARPGLRGARRRPRLEGDL